MSLLLLATNKMRSAFSILKKYQVGTLAPKRPSVSRKRPTLPKHRSLASAFVCLLSSLSSVSAQEPVLKPLEYAQNFKIEKYPQYTLLTVQNAYRNSTSQFQYALVPKTENALPPNIPDNAELIRTPVEKVALMETVYVGYLDAIGELQSIQAAATADYVSHPDVRNRIESGHIKSIQSGQKLNTESLLLLQPDLIFTTSLGEGSFEFSPQIERAGLSVVLTADYMERHPLARAEWIKFIAALYNKDAEADAYFEKIKNAYLLLTEKPKNLKTRPTVFCGAPYSGVWHVPGGDSFFARFIKDAGGHYLWADDTSQGGLPLDTERVFLKAADADFWINPSFYRSLASLFGADPRFNKFSAAQNERVYNNTRQVNPKGGNNIWERGIVHPEEVLADLIKILHPESMPDHDFVYFEQLK